jgi:multiple sugar transport system permease protein
VTLPLAAPGVVTALVFTFIAAWNEFVIALTLTGTPDVQPLTVGVTVFIGLYDVQWQYLFASSLVAIVPVVILFILIEKWLVGGLTAGSVK